MANLSNRRELLQFLYKSPNLHLHRNVLGWNLVQSKTQFCDTDRCLKLPLFGEPKKRESG